ncbi:MAG: AAA family ATPase [Alphaproteobacteria bacterium]|nr:AAA family ATPase [Alphaproteobacteria bacterium]
MLTRIELDGFKSFEGFAVDLSPHTVVLGPNGVGKSNLFDAIHFLSALANGSVADAAREMRGQPHELFSFGPDGRPRGDMKLAVEVLLPTGLRDSWGNEVDVEHPRLRYEVAIERRLKDGVESLAIVSERATSIYAKEDRWRPYGRPPSKPFTRQIIRRQTRSRRDTPFLNTVEHDEDKQLGPAFALHHDGKAGRIRYLPATGADATVLSTISTAEFKHLFALREEFRSWRFFQLDPVSIRDSARGSWSQQLEPDGRNLGRVLNRIRMQTRSDTNPEGVLPDIATDLADLVDGVRALRVEADEQIRDFRIRLEMADRVIYSSQLISDGTLRLLALLTLFNDPDFSGLLCMEEPENGVHPERLMTLLRLMRDRVTDPEDEDPDPNEPLQQILTNSHSPVVLSAVQGRDQEALFADMVIRTDPATGGRVKRTRLRPIRSHSSQGRLLNGEAPPYVTSFEVERFLKTVKTGS